MPTKEDLKTAEQATARLRELLEQNQQNSSLQNWPDDRFSLKPVLDGKQVQVSVTQPNGTAQDYQLWVYKGQLTLMTPKQVDAVYSREVMENFQNKLNDNSKFPGGVNPLTGDEAKKGYIDDKRFGYLDERLRTMGTQAKKITDAYHQNLSGAPELKITIPADQMAKIPAAALNQEPDVPMPAPVVKPAAPVVKAQPVQAPVAAAPKAAPPVVEKNPNAATPSLLKPNEAPQGPAPIDTSASAAQIAEMKPEANTAAEFYDSARKAITGMRNGKMDGDEFRPKLTESQMKDVIEAHRKAGSPYVAQLEAMSKSTDPAKDFTRYTNSVAEGHMAFEQQERDNARRQKIQERDTKNTPDAIRDRALEGIDRKLKEYGIDPDDLKKPMSLQGDKPAAYYYHAAQNGGAPEMTFNDEAPAVKPEKQPDVVQVAEQDQPAWSQPANKGGLSL